MKKIISLIILTITLSGCSIVIPDADLIDFSDMESNKPIRIEFAIYRTGSSFDAYHYILYDNDEFITERGNRTGNDLSTKLFLKGRNAFAGVMLPSEDVNKIVELTEKIVENDTGITRQANDTSSMQIFYQDKIVEFEIGSPTDSEEVWQLCELLTSNSPLKFRGQTCIMATVDPTHSH